MDETGYGWLDKLLGEHEAEWRDKAERIFYLATAPALFAPIARVLGTAGLAEERTRARIVVEKPLAHDLDSLRDINRTLARFTDGGDDPDDPFEAASALARMDRFARPPGFFRPVSFT
jgi:glucose-6-phosphate 1-dehydrogenase